MTLWATQRRVHNKHLATAHAMIQNEGRTAAAAMLSLCSRLVVCGKVLLLRVLTSLSKSGRGSCAAKVMALAMCGKLCHICHPHWQWGSKNTPTLAADSNQRRRVRGWPQGKSNSGCGRGGKGSRGRYRYRYAVGEGMRTGRRRQRQRRQQRAAATVAAGGRVPRRPALKKKASHDDPSRGGTRG